MPHLLFSTAFGTCGLAWEEAHVTGFALPAQNDGLTAEPLARISPPRVALNELPEWLAALVARVQGHLAGRLQDFSDVAIDWARVSEFQQGVYRRTLAIKAGSTKSYGEIARELSLPGEAARAVGTALGSNPWPLLVPCHRVVSASGRMTGFSAPGGILTKTRLLALEGAELLSE